MNKTESLKEKLRQALSSTARVISDDLGINSKKNIKNSENQNPILSLFFVSDFHLIQNLQLQLLSFFLLNYSRVLGRK